MLTPGPLFNRTFSSQVFNFFKSKVLVQQISFSRSLLQQSNRCSNALKCQKWAIKKILMLTPGPLVDRTFSSQVFKFFKSKGRRRRNHEQKILMLTPGPLERTFSKGRRRTFSSQVFKFFKSKGRRQISF